MELYYNKLIYYTYISYANTKLHTCKHH